MFITMKDYNYLVERYNYYNDYNRKNDSMFSYDDYMTVVDILDDINDSPDNERVLCVSPQQYRYVIKLSKYYDALEKVLTVQDDMRIDQVAKDFAEAEYKAISRHFYDYAFQQMCKYGYYRIGDTIEISVSELYNRFGNKLSDCTIQTSMHEEQMRYDLFASDQSLACSDGEMVVITGVWDDGFYLKSVKNKSAVIFSLKESELNTACEEK